MAISFPLTLPTITKTKSVSIRAISTTPMPVSEFTGQQQVNVFPGQWWEIDVDLPLMLRPAAEVWLAFLTSLNGREGTFLIGDPDAATPLGTGGGTPLINGGSQTGQDLMTDGWNPSETVLKAGDYIQISNNLYKVLQDATTDVGGNVTLSIFPKIRTAHADGATITVNNTVGEFRLDNRMTSWSTDNVGLYSITFSAREAL